MQISHGKDGPISLQFMGLCLAFFLFLSQKSSGFLSGGMKIIMTLVPKAKNCFYEKNFAAEKQ
jgi:hypothetical protein